MIKQSKILMVLALILVIISGCSNSTGNSQEGNSSTKEATNDNATITLKRYYNGGITEIKTDTDTVNKYKPLINESEITLYVENVIFANPTRNNYVFNGFLGEDTLVFGKLSYYKVIDILHPAKIGYKFRLQEEGDIEYEIIDFNRDKGFIKLKVNKANDEIPVEIDNKGE